MTHRKLSRIVGRLHDAHALPGVEGTGVALAHVEAGRPGRVGGRVGGAGPARGLAPLGLVGAVGTLLTLGRVAVVHVARLAGN